MMFVCMYVSHTFGCYLVHSTLLHSACIVGDLYHVHTYSISISECQTFAAMHGLAGNQRRRDRNTGMPHELPVLS